MCIYAHMHYIYIYILYTHPIAVDLNSFICKRQFFVKESFAKTACKRQPCEWSGRQPNAGARPCCDNPTRKQQSFIEFHCFQVPLTMQRCRVAWVSMGTFSFTTAFAELLWNFRKRSFANKTTTKFHTQNRACGCSSTWLQNSTGV